MGCKYETQKDPFLFLPYWTFRRISRQSSAEELQNGTAAENRRGGKNREKPQIARIGQSEMSPHGRPSCNHRAAADPEKRPLRLHLLHKPVIELIHA
jgi:hypothetical protein